MEPPIKLLIADDHRMFADGLESILNQYENFNVLGTAENGHRLISLIEAHKPDVVLLDISMPGMDGRDAAQYIIKNFPAVKIMVLTMHTGEDTVVPMVQLGVQGYVLKNAGKSELAEAIQTIYNGGHYYSPEITATLARGLSRAQTGQAELTDREKEILQKIFQGLSNNQIAEELFISPRTVETHRKNLMSKTGTKNAAQLINYGLEHGLVKKG